MSHFSLEKIENTKTLPKKFNLKNNEPPAGVKVKKVNITFLI